MLAQKTFLTLTGIIFSVLCAIHILRLLYGITIVVAGWSVPYWFSFVGAAVAGYIAYNSFQLQKKAKK